MNMFRTLLAITVIGFTSGCCTTQQKPASSCSKTTSKCTTCETCAQGKPCKKCCN